MDHIKLMDYLLTINPMGKSQYPNRDALVLFESIQLAFSPNRGAKVVSVHPYFINSLSVCAQLLLMENPSVRPIPPDHYDEIFDATLHGFCDFLILTIKNKGAAYDEETEQYWINNLPLSPTLIVSAQKVERFI